MRIVDVIWFNRSAMTFIGFLLPAIVESSEKKVIRKLTTLSIFVCWYYYTLTAKLFLGFRRTADDRRMKRRRDACRNSNATNGIKNIIFFIHYDKKKKKTLNYYRGEKNTHSTSIYHGRTFESYTDFVFDPPSQTTQLLLVTYPPQPSVGARRNRVS